jgi:hypothetical protein
MLASPIHGTIAATGIPVGKDHLDVLPRALAGIGSGLGALVVFGGALWSAIRFARKRSEGMGALAGGNALIAFGTLVLASGGLLQGVVGQDESFVISLAVGISVIYAGFVVASGGRIALFPTSPNSRRNSLPANARGNASATSTRVGNL